MTAGVTGWMGGVASPPVEAKDCFFFFVFFS